MKQAALLIALVAVVSACGPESPPESSVSTAQAADGSDVGLVVSPVTSAGASPVVSPALQGPGKVIFPTEVVLAPGPVWMAPAGRSPLGGPGELSPRKPLRLGEVATVETEPVGPLVAWDRAHLHVGQRITVKGRVVNTHRSRSRVVFLNFDTDWKGKFYVPVFRGAHTAMPVAAETFFLYRTIYVTGEVALYEGTPNIAVSDLSQIQVVEDANTAGFAD